MNRRRTVTRAIAAAAAIPIAAPFAARAQDVYPNRPITLIVPFPPGIVDSKARLIAGRVAEILGQPLVVENRAGAGQRIGTLALARAPRDGYTLGVVTQAGVVMAPAIDPASLKYDYQKDFQYLTYGYAGPFMFATHAKSGFRTMREFVALARSKPGQLRFSSSGIGTSYHVWSEVLFDKAGVQLLHVPYRGAAQAQTDLIGGQVDVMLTTAGAFGEVNAGRLVALGVSSEARLTTLPQTPTFRELGIDIAFESWLGFAAPAGIPAQALERLNAAFRQALDGRDLREKIGGDGSEVRYTTPAEFTRVIEGEVRIISEINRRLKLELQ